MSTELSGTAARQARTLEQQASTEKATEKRKDAKATKIIDDVAEMSIERAEAELAAAQRRAKRKKKTWWNKRKEIDDARPSTSRAFYEGNVLDWEAPEETKRNVHVHFDSEYREQRRPVLPGYDPEDYEVLTKGLAKELGIVIPSGRWTDNGHCKVGHDAIAKIIRLDLYEEREKGKRGSTDVDSVMRKRENEFRKQSMAHKLSMGDLTGAFGSIKTASGTGEDDMGLGRLRESYESSKSEMGRHYQGGDTGTSEDYDAQEVDE